MSVFVNRIEAFNYHAKFHQAGNITLVNLTPKSSKPPVLLVPPFYQTAESFLLNGRGSVSEWLTDDYDVWLYNGRGNILTENYLNPDPYWYFDFEEVALVDTKQAINYILKETRKTNLSYIGFCLGAT